VKKTNTLSEETRGELKNITEAIISLIPDATVILFGSYARGEQKKHSDLDICVVTPAMPLKSIDMIDKVRYAARSKTSLPLDVLVYTYEEFEDESSMRSLVAHDIAKEGVVLNA
jgi:predicted nucleotidyltransferase